MSPSQLLQPHPPLRQKRLASVSWNSQVGQGIQPDGNLNLGIVSRVPLPATFPGYHSLCLYMHTSSRPFSDKLNIEEQQNAPLLKNAEGPDLNSKMINNF